MIYETGKQFSSKDNKREEIQQGDYEDCGFSGLYFSGFDLSGYKFSNCDFRDCDFSNAKIHRTVFREVIFKNCKLMGVNFENAHSFNISFSFEECVLDHSSFYQLDIRKTIFKNCSLKDADFSETNLLYSLFDHSDLAGAIFDQTILDNANFITAVNFSIEPNKNHLKKTKFAKDNLSGLLNSFNIIIE